MNTAHLKSYAPRARKDFIAAVTARAAKFGITATHIEPIVEQGDVALIGDKAYPRSLAENRRKLEARIEQQGFPRVMEAMAYTWFNRFMAIRYMELHGYLDHGRRVLSHPEKQGAFEILEVCTEVELPGVDKDRVVELKLDGSKDEELYRLLLLGQCHALHQAMPFLFEAIEDDSELLLPDNLTKTDSLIRHLVDDIPEDNWDNVEIIGWLYQFYISEKKDQVIGKVVKSQDIPAATQLFTPNWIVKYMVQNSLGAQWLATYPDSKLKGHMEYYIEPAEQTDEVKAQLAAITPSQLNPEELTLIDPACGSGHILVEAYELFKAIYLERGYRQRDVPQLILEKNLYGLDIDERAAQLTGFAVMMKGRADDRRLFEKSIKLNVMALTDSTGFDAEGLAKGIKLANYGLNLSDLTELKRLFEHATTFGSLIQMPEELAKKLAALKQLGEATNQDLFVSEALKRLQPLVQQAELYAAQYDAVVANPPYMDRRYLNAELKRFAALHFPESKSNLFSMSIERFLCFLKPTGSVGLMTPFVWMFLSSYEAIRSTLLEGFTLRSLVHPEYHAVWSSAAVPICTFIIQNHRVFDYSASFIRLVDFYGEAIQPVKTLEAIANPKCGWMHRAKPDDFGAIPGRPIAYWLSPDLIDLIGRSDRLGEVCDVRQGLSTGDTTRFLRFWHEVDISRIGFGMASVQEFGLSEARWAPYNKGGDYRKWYGNTEYVLDWGNSGARLAANAPTSIIRNPEYFFRRSISWSDVTSSYTSFRSYPEGYVFDTVGHSAFFEDRTDELDTLAYLNTCVFQELIGAINPTFHFSGGYFAKLPALREFERGALAKIAEKLIRVHKADWDRYERSVEFEEVSLLKTPTASIMKSFESFQTAARLEVEEVASDEGRIAKWLTAETGVERFALSLPEPKQITLTVNPAYRYGDKLTEEELWTRFRQDSMEELVSYAIGCMMGRYSLDTPGLIYAHSGNEGFSPSRYTTFPADDDGIVPITDTDWFPDDAAHRVIEFIAVAWDKSHLEANLTFLADNLSPKKNEASRETIRRYLCDSFFKDHLQTYKKRPIYWLFSSGKQKAFQCLVYLHRYNKGTLARMRTEYVIPLQGKMSSRIDQLDSDITATSSTAHRKKLEKERDKLAKQRAELQAFDEKLRHYADQRISLDLDDGVKVNYGKFGDLLAEVKAITGAKAT